MAQVILLEISSRARRRRMFMKNCSMSRSETGSLR